MLWGLCLLWKLTQDFYPAISCHFCPSLCIYAIYPISSLLSDIVHSATIKWAFLSIIPNVRFYFLQCMPGMSKVFDRNLIGRPGSLFACKMSCLGIKVPGVSVWGGLWLTLWVPVSWNPSRASKPCLSEAFTHWAEGVGSVLVCEDCCCTCVFRH